MSNLLDKFNALPDEAKEKLLDLIQQSVDFANNDSASSLDALDIVGHLSDIGEFSLGLAAKNADEDKE